MVSISPHNGAINIEIDSLLWSGDRTGTGI